MELLLNLAWAMLAGTAISAFLTSAPARRKQFLLAFGALCCALLFLFPTISVSDDLHLQALVTEDSNANKRLANAAHLTAVEHCAPIPVVAGALLAGLFLLTGWVGISAAVPHAASFLERPVFGRAPPLPSAA